MDDVRLGHPHPIKCRRGHIERLWDGVVLDNVTCAKMI